MNVHVRRYGWAAAALAVSLLTSRASAQQVLSAKTVDLPDAKELIAKYNKAVGGDQWKSHKSARMKATLEVPAQGLRADIEAMNIFATKNYNGVLGTWSFDQNGDTTLSTMSGRQVKNGKFDDANAVTLEAPR